MEEHIQALMEEHIQDLIEEAIRRGFVQGCTYTNLAGQEHVATIDAEHYNDFGQPDDIRLRCGNGDGLIYRVGTGWGEVISPVDIGDGAGIMQQILTSSSGTSQSYIDYSDYVVDFDKVSPAIKFWNGRPQKELTPYQKKLQLKQQKRDEVIRLSEIKHKVTVTSI